MSKHNASRHDVGYQSVSDDYLDKRQLKHGAAGWVLLAGLGVSYVISGDFAGWNFGLASGGFGGMLIATILMAVMYTGMVFTLAELSSSLPTAGGGYSFARRAMGPWGGYITGTAILLEYAIAPAAIAIFIGGYVESLIGVDGPLVYAAFYAVFVGIHLWGAGEALKDKEIKGGSLAGCLFKGGAGLSDPLGEKVTIIRQGGKSRPGFNGHVMQLIKIIRAYGAKYHHRPSSSTARTATPAVTPNRLACSGVSTTFPAGDMATSSTLQR